MATPVLFALSFPVPAVAGELSAPAAGLGAITRRIEQPAQAPGEVDAQVEIPAGSFTKYELDPRTGVLRVDRFQSMPVVYPANYGTLPGSLAGDGDPLDVLVYSREPIVPGALIRVRPIGVLRMKDGGEQDDKVIAVPAAAVDPTYAEVLDVSDLAQIELQRLTAFFQTYKQLPAGRQAVEIEGVGDQAAALKIIEDALSRYSAVVAPPARPAASGQEQGDSGNRSTSPRLAEVP